MSEQEPAPESFLDDDGLTARAWARALRAGVLLGQRCPACEHVTAAPKAACARCGERDLAVESLPTAGEVYSQTTIAVAPEGFEGPYRVGLVDLGEARVLGRLPADADIGEEVSLAGVVAAGEPSIARRTSSDRRSDGSERVAPRFE